jgi:hypothetical protein
MIGTDHYYRIRWQPPEKIRMLEMLKRIIPPDKALLSFEDFIVDQHSEKQAAARGEIGWHLDREIVVARAPAEIEQQAATGRFPYYLMPLAHWNQEAATYLVRLNKELRQRYNGRLIRNLDQGEATKDGKFLRAAMRPYMIYDLSSKAADR